MRLLKTGPYVPGDEKLEVIQKWGKAIPPYAILSHTWSTQPDDEVLLSDVQNGSCGKKPAYSKLENAMQRAMLDGWGWIWIDTACIDKTSSVELSEAINSMYDYYKNAQTCYAYLADVESEKTGQDFEKSRWWKRGWTLQELLAPKKVEFYNSAWQPIGDKNSLASIIPDITGIDRNYLTGELPVEHASIAKRMSWAASRETTRDEDMAYSMIGLFDVNMPMLYGEGPTKAFLRLQEEVMRVSEDQSIFAWVKPDGGISHHGLLADSPKDFQQTGNTICYTDMGDQKPATMSARGLNISLPLVSKTQDRVIAALHCPVPGGNSGWLAVYLSKLKTGGNQYARVECDKLASVVEQGLLQEIYVRQKFSNFAVQEVYPNHYFQLRSLRLTSQYQELANYKIVSSSATRGQLPGVVTRSNPPIAEGRPWSDVPMVYNISKTAGALSVALLVRRSFDNECFIILLGATSDSDYNVGVAAIDAFDVSLRTVQFSDLEESFQPRSFGEYFELQHHRVRVGKEELIRDNQKIYLIDIEVKAYPKPPKAIEILEGAVDSLVPGQGRSAARNDFRDKMRRKLLPTRSM